MPTATSAVPTGVTPASPPDWTAADLVEHFGPIPLWRVRLVPPPGTATEQDVIDVHDRENRLCELVDGVLVEKPGGVTESYLALLLGGLLNEFLRVSAIGIALGADGMARLSPGLIRIPDVSFITWERLAGRGVPSGPCLPLAPDLAVEVLSPSNTPKEMERKLRDYFASGVRLVWYVDPAKRTAEVFTGVGQSVVLGAGDALDGGEVLPGFALPLAQLFAGLGPGQEK